MPCMQGDVKWKRTFSYIFYVLYWAGSSCFVIANQGFIQAFLLTFVFHEGLSFMTLGHNPMCVSTLAIATGGSYGALLWAPPVGSEG